MNYRRIKGMFLQYWYISNSRLERFMDIFFWAPFNLLVWAFVAIFIQQMNANLNLMSIFLGGVFLWTMFNRTSIDVPVYVLEDFWSRSLYNIFVSPLTTLELYVALVLYTAYRMILSFTVLFFVALFALHFNLFSIAWLQMVVLFIPLMFFAWSVGFIIVGLVFRYGTRIQTLAWTFPFFLQPFLCVFYPLAALPAWLQVIAKLIPATWVFEGFRSIVLGRPVEHVGYAYVGSIILLLLTLLFFMRGVEKSKRSGLLARS